ncbi:MAG: hypothetical protein GX657_03075 [Chloroflexi bacterium]|nr:hypothetical protein [Chloroflexota bacterium]
MELADYFRIIAKRAWIIVLAVVLTTGSAFVVSKIQTPVYRSTVYLNVIPARLDYSLVQTSKMYMRNYAGQIRSRTTASRVIDRLQLDITPAELAEKLTVSSIESDFLLQIDADDYDPVLAGQIAQTTAEVFAEKIDVDMLEVDKRDRLQISIRDWAEVGRLHKPNWKTNSLAGALFGLIVGLLVVFVLEWLQADIIRTSEDVERHTGVAVLGLIPTAASQPARSAAARRGREQPLAASR